MYCETAMLNTLSVFSQPLIKKRKSSERREGGEGSDIAVKCTCPQLPTDAAAAKRCRLVPASA